MTETCITSLSALHASTDAKLDTGESVANSHAVLASTEGHTVGVQAWRQHGETKRVHTLNGMVVPPEAIDLLLKAYGAHPSTPAI